MTESTQQRMSAYCCLFSFSVYKTRNKENAFAMQGEVKAAVVSKWILIFRNVCNSKEDQLWDTSYLCWGMWTHFFLPLLCIFPHSILQDGWQSQIGISGNAVYAFLFSGMKCRKQVMSQHAVGKWQGTGGVWGRVILLTKPSRYFTVKLHNHRELHESFTMPGVSQERAVRVECFLILDSVLGWGQKKRQDTVSCWVIIILYNSFNIIASCKIHFRGREERTTAQDSLFPSMPSQVADDKVLLHLMNR